jgi:hypothetical protein
MPAIRLGNVLVSGAKVSVVDECTAASQRLNLYWVAC